MVDAPIPSRQAIARIRRVGASSRSNRTGSATGSCCRRWRFLVLFLAYPLGLGVWLSFTDASIGRTESSSAWRTTNGCGMIRLLAVGLQHAALHGVASIIKFGAGLYLALLLNQHMPFKAIIRAAILIPFIVPTVLSAIAFWWIFDTQFSIISWSLRSSD